MPLFRSEKIRSTFAAGLMMLAIQGCTADSEDASETPATATPMPETATPETPSSEHPEGWTDATHGDDAAPDYDTVFPSAKVNRIDITIAAADWQKMVDQMTELLGPFGEGGGTGGGGMGEPPPFDTTACDGKAAGDACTSTTEGTETEGVCTADPMGGSSLICIPVTPPEAIDACDGQSSGATCSYVAEDGSTVSGQCLSFPGSPLSCTSTGGQPPDDGGMGAGLDFVSDLVWVPSDLTFQDSSGQDITWRYVGIRFKGNSSLAIPWQSGVWKLPFKLDFDEFEEDQPGIKNQRFYGFKHLGMSNGWSDDSLLHEKVMDDLLRLAGIPAPRAAFYRLYINHGTGPLYFGLYTATELIESDMLQTQLGSSDGNLYKPEGEAANWTTFDAASFAKENNEDEADWSDVEAAITALNADRTDLATWRAGLESSFNVEAFGEWLAMNTLAVNWDTYGQIAHNYYLYGDPADGGRLRWLPWDHSLALSTTGGMGEALSISLDEVSASWPLIRFLMDDPSFEEEYRANLATLLNGAFALESTQARIQAEHDLIAPYVTGENGEVAPYTNLTSQTAFDDSVNVLFQHVADRHAAAEEYLGL